MNVDPMRRWKRLAIFAAAAIAAALPMRLWRDLFTPPPPKVSDETPARFVGRESCRECHETEFKKWLGSDHDDAMDIADETTVLGDFDNAVFTAKGVTTRFFKKDGRFMVNTEGPDGKNADFEIKYTFGVDPLQQYMIEFPGGRLQVLNVSWDSIRDEWFVQYPDQVIPAGDWLHWTRNGQNWNGMCAECHSTNLKKNYDPETDTYNTTWSEIDVSCEACHGPASRHVAWARTDPMARPELDNYGLVVDTRNLDAAKEAALCAPCHSRRSELGDYDHCGEPLLDVMLPSLLEENLYFADGQIQDEVYVWGSFTQSKMYNRGVKCSDCHDVHSQNRHFEGNALCFQCHRKEAFDSEKNHFHKKVVNGKPSDGARCVKCHMPERPYMVIDLRADHSIRIPNPRLSKAIGTPNACNAVGCHANESVDWAVAAYNKWYGLSEKPHYGSIIDAGRKGLEGADEGLRKTAMDPLLPAVVRATALSLLVQYPNEETLLTFEKSLADDEGLVRQTAVRYLPPLPPERAVETAAPLLFDPLKAVRIQAAVFLAEVPRDFLKPYQAEALDAGLKEYVAAESHSLDFAGSAHNLGNLYARLGDTAKAEAFYRRAIAVDDLFAPAKMNLAVLLSRRGRNDEAEKLLREVVAAYPKHYEAHYSLGLLLAEQGKYEEAALHLAETLKGIPNHEGAARNLKAIREYLENLKRSGGGPRQ